MGLPINLPRRLVKNKSAFTAEWGNSIREAIWRLSKRKFPDQTFSVSGVVLKLQIGSGSEIGKYKITDGVVNSETPTLDDDPIGGDPEGEPPTSIPEFTVEETTYVWIKCVGVFGTPDTFTVTIETQTEDDVPAGTEITATGFTSFYKIGKVEFEAAEEEGDKDIYTIVNQHGGGNLGVDSWGLYNLWWRA